MEPTVLVINADDLGFSADINSTIEEGHRMGVITNATLMVDGPAVADALTVIRRNPRLGVGLHLDLCPVTGLYRRPYQEMRESLRTAEMQNQVAGEVERQIVRFQSLGLEFTHMDSHRHFHALPEIYPLVVGVAASHGLRTIRLSQDWILPRTPSVFWSDEFFLSAKELLRTRRIVFPDRFVYGWKEYDAGSFEPGLNELMVHVAKQEESYLKEYNLLSPDTFSRSLGEAGILLKSYRGATELVAQ